MSQVQLPLESNISSPQYEETLQMIQGLKSDTVLLDGEGLQIPSVVAVARHSNGCRADVMRGKGLAVRTNKSVEFLEEYLKQGYQVYGVSTGFGGSADSRTTDSTGLQTALLQTIQAGDLGLHCMPISWVRATILVRCNHLLRGHSGVRYQIIKSMMLLLNAGMTPIVPLRGSISASGDLVPLAYLAGILEGNPDLHVFWTKGSNTSVISAREALEATKLEPITLGPKEGLGLLNGAAASAGVAALCLQETNQLAILSEAIVAMSCEALAGNAENYHHFAAAVRPHPGQLEVARNIRHFLDGSKLLEDIRLGNRQVKLELNSTQDNPIIDVENADVFSCCNFQAASVTSAAEKARLALQSLGKLLFAVSSELINPDLNQGLPPPNLAADDPSRSFFAKGIDISMAAYMSELSYLANPMFSHVQTAEMNNQAINSLALLSCRCSMQTVDLVSLMCAAHLYVRCQALDLRVLHSRFQDALENIIGATARDVFDTLPSKDWQSFKTALVTTARSSWKDSAKENLEVRCRLLADRLAPQVISCMADKGLHSSKHRDDPVAALAQFTRRVGAESKALFDSMNMEFVEKPDTEEYLRTASRHLYGFVRHTLKVPFHRGFAEHPTVVGEGGGR
ncbi:L-Aspartase-like protein [Aspergillus aurantiobrunneus]